MYYYYASDTFIHRHCGVARQAGVFIGTLYSYAWGCNWLGGILNVIHII